MLYGEVWFIFPAYFIDLTVDDPVIGIEGRVLVGGAAMAVQVVEYVVASSAHNEIVEPLDETGSARTCCGESALLVVSASAAWRELCTTRLPN